MPIFPGEELVPDQFSKPEQFNNFCSDFFFLLVFVGGSLLLRLLSLIIEKIPNGHVYEGLCLLFPDAIFFLNYVF